MTTVATPRAVATAVTTSTTATAGKHLPVDASSGALTVTLPATTTANAGAHLSVEKRDSSSNTVTISGSIRGSNSTVTLYWQNETIEFTGDANGSWWPVAGHKTKAALDSRYSYPAVMAPAATGVAATDTANLQAAINATPLGGTLYIPFGTYYLNAALTCPQSITIEGAGVTSLYKGSSQGGSSSQPNSPYFAGTVLYQTAAATDVLKLTGTGMSANLRRFGIIFAAGLASTGTAVNGTPTATTGTGYDFGVTDFNWEDIYVWGHDGNHYAFVLINTQYGQLTNLRSYGGGTLRVVADLGTINAGNLVISCLFGSVINAGTANGIQHEAATTTGHPGQVNFLCYIRPQISIGGAANTQGTQIPYNDNGGAGWAQFNTLIAPDFEGVNTTAQLTVGPTTQVIGSPYIDGSVLRYRNGLASGHGAAGQTIPGNGQFAAFGYYALGAQTGVGQYNTAVGYYAASAVATGQYVTAVGNQAAKFNTGSQNNAFGANALLGVNGTSNGSQNNAFGWNALQALTTGGSNVAMGQSTANLLTTGSQNTAVGRDAGNYTNGSLSNAIVTGSNNTFLGYQAGSNAGDINNGVAIGSGATTGQDGIAIGRATSAAAGSVAIGRDNTGGAATTATVNTIALGTAKHQVQLSNNTTGTGSAALGANSPATTPTAPYTWFKMMSSDGSTVYVPAWK